MLVHAHPDDEASTTSVTMARYVAEGAQVTLVTCTLGEEGEIVAEDLAHLSTDDALGQHRIGELTEAMAALGVTDFVRLGGDGRYRDSGMLYDSDGRVIPMTEVDPRAFWLADLLAAANDLVPIIRDRRPQVLITYNEYGGYGHPDHIQAHRVATYAVTLAGVAGYRPDLGEPWQVDRVLWSAWAERAFRDGLRRLRESGDVETFAGLDPDGELPPMTTPDEDLAVRIEGAPWHRQKLAALQAHRSQVDLAEAFWQLMTSPEGADEYYRLATGTPFPGPGIADDLFAGLPA